MPAKLSVTSDNARMVGERTMSFDLWSSCSGRSKTAAWRILELMQSAQPTLDFGLQNVQRHRAVIEELRMKSTNIEALAQGLLSPRAQAQDFASAHGARQRLAGQCEVAIDHVRARLPHR